MKRNELKEQIARFVEERKKEADGRWEDLPMCEKFFNEMRDNGFAEAAICFQKIIYLQLVIDPTKTDEELLNGFLESMKER